MFIWLTEKMVKKRKYVESLDGRRKKIYKEKIIY